MLFSLILTFFLTNLLSSSLMILLLPNPVHSLLFLVLVFLNSAGILITFNLEFIALLLIIIYVGAIAILFLFILMMIDIKVATTLKTDWFVYLIFGGILSALFFAGTYLSIFAALLDSSNYVFTSTDIWVNFITNINNCSVFGHILYSYYLFFFLVAGLILLLALLGAVHLTHKPNKIKEQKNFYQLSKNPKIHVIN